MFSSVTKKCLPNGLTLIVVPDPKQDLSCILTWIDVGQLDDPSDCLGLAQLTQQLSFKATQKRSVGDVTFDIKALGGYIDGAAMYDHSYFYTVTPNGNWMKALELQADIVSSPLFDEEELEREKAVLRHEFKRKQDLPDVYSWERLLRLTFTQHPLKRWRLDSESNWSAMNKGKLMEFHQQFYTPRNTTIAIVGNVSVDEVFSHAERLLGERESGSEASRVFNQEPEQKEPRMERVSGDISHPFVKMGFQAPSFLSADYFACSFLSILIGKGRSSRLYRYLKEHKGIAQGVGSSYFATRDAGILTFEAETRSESIPICEEEMWMEIDRLRRDPPTSLEIEKIRNISEANFFAEKQDVMGQAYSLAFFESLGGVERGQEYIDGVRKVRPKDVVDICEKVCRFERMNLLEYAPSHLGEGAPVGSRLESLKKRVEQKVTLLGEVKSPKTEDVAPAAEWGNEYESSVSPISVIGLEGGSTLIHQKNSGSPLVTIAVYFPGGRLDETEGNCGITQMTLLNTLKGSENRSADELAFEVESMGSSIQVESTADLFGYSMSVLNRSFEKSVALLSDVILHPVFPEAELEKEKQNQMVRIQNLKDDMFRHPIELFYRGLFGLHPYGLPRNGTVESVEMLTRSDLADWHSQSFSWKEMVVSVVGNIDRQRAEDAVKKYFSVQTDGETESLAKLYPVVPQRGVREKIRQRETKQTGMVLGFAGVPVRNERFAALEVLRNILSGMGGKLYMELRERHGLVYNVTTFNIGLLRGGAFFTYLATSPSKEDEVRHRLLAELAKAKEMIPSPKDMQMAKAYARGSHQISLQGNGALAYAYVYQQIVGSGALEVEKYNEAIDRVTPEQVRIAASETIDLDQYVMGIVKGRSG